MGVGLDDITVALDDIRVALGDIKGGVALGRDRKLSPEEGGELFFFC